MKASKSYACSNSKSEPNKRNDKGKYIIEVEPNNIFSTTNIYNNELEHREEGEHLFYPKMWVKVSPLQFIVDSGSQKNLISTDFLKWFGLLITPHPQLYNIKWLHQ